MVTRLLARLGWGFVVLWGTTVITFLIIHTVPADPVRVYAGPNVDAETIRQIQEEMGFDHPLVVQYYRYMKNLSTGNLGTSIITGEKVIDAIFARFPVTFILAITAVFFWMLIAIPLGVFTAKVKGSRKDRLILLISLITISLPIFWLARINQYLFSYKWGIFPVAGLDNWNHIILPAGTLAIAITGYYARLIHTNMVEVLNSDYIKVARAKGLSETIILFKHGLRNAIIPVITILGIDIAALMGGVVFTENVFALPGLGSLALQSVFNLDVPMIMGVVIFSSGMVVTANILVDLAYLILDPRIKEYT